MSRRGRLTFDVVEKHAEFDLFKEFESSASSFSCYGREVVDSDEPVSMLEIT